MCSCIVYMKLTWESTREPSKLDWQLSCLGENLSLALSLLRRKGCPLPWPRVETSKLAICTYSGRVCLCCSRAGRAQLPQLLAATIARHNRVDLLDNLAAFALYPQQVPPALRGDGKLGFSSPSSSTLLKSRRGWPRPDPPQEAIELT